jgi:hypothetical protein
VAIDEDHYKDKEWMVVGPSGSAVEIEENSTRHSRADVDGKWLR